jgi:hypothetical protein
MEGTNEELLLLVCYNLKKGTNALAIETVTE